jgi:hypothetical protein
VPIVIKRKVREVKEDVLALVGLAEEYRAYHALRPITWPHFKPGARVQIIAKTGAWRFICKTGDAGVVQKMCQASSPPNKNPDDDLYIVRLDTPRVAGKEVAYLTYKELAGI